MIKAQTLKGFRDFLPNEARKRQYVVDTLKKVFESYGFEPLETPALEYEEILLGKYGDEGDKLMYRFTDNGDRKVAMRYDQTVPLARVVAEYGSKSSPQGKVLLPMPFKRYQIQNVWRAENTQKGRYREFLQCDIDTVGSYSYWADVEIIACVINASKKLGFKNTKILINDRSVFANLKPQFVSVIDKLEKIGKQGVIDELCIKGMAKLDAEKFINSFDDSKPTPYVLTIFERLKKFGFTENTDYAFRASLARGLDYYTSSIFELVSDDYKNGSLGGGGRYDNLIGMFTNKQVPAVGFSFGFDRLMEAMEELNFFPDDLNTTKVLVTVFSPELKEKSLQVSSTLREKGINTELYLDENAKLEKQLKYADQKQIPYVIVVGPDEAKNNTVTLKNLKTREQKTLSLTETVSQLV